MSKDAIALRIALHAKFGNSLSGLQKKGCEGGVGGFARISLWVWGGFEKMLELCQPPFFEAGCAPGCMSGI